MKRMISLLAAAVALTGCAAAPQPGRPSTYLYYLHGKVVEDFGPTGVSPRFGQYDYPGIIGAFSRAGFEVLSEVRPKDTDPSGYADKIVKQIESKLAAGVRPERITVVGASKGAVIAMLVSSRLRVPGIRYVFLANCNDWMERTYSPRFTGEVLSIYETSDDIGQSCGPLAARSPGIGRFKEIKLETGLGHGIVYRPLPEWIGPATAWAAEAGR